MAMKKIKSVKKNGIEYFYDAQRQQWKSGYYKDKGSYEYLEEDTVLNCPLFEIEYEEDELSDLEKFYDTIQGVCKDFENKKPGK